MFCEACQNWYGKHLHYAIRTLYIEIWSLSLVYWGKSNREQKRVVLPLFLRAECQTICDKFGLKVIFGNLLLAIFLNQKYGFAGNSLKFRKQIRKMLGECAPGQWLTAPIPFQNAGSATGLPTRRHPVLVLSLHLFSCQAVIFGQAGSSRLLQMPLLSSWYSSDLLA